MNYDIVTVGNAVIDAFLGFEENNPFIRLSSSRELCIKYGEKILLRSCDFLLGGNACNVAVGLTRAGQKTALFAEIGSDEFSERIVQGLKKESVDLSFVKHGPGQSSFSIGLNFEGERTLLVEHHDRKHDFQFQHLTTRAIYLTSVGHAWQHVYQSVSHYLQSHHETILAFNPGSVQYKDGVETFAYLLPLTTVLFVNKQEAERLVGKKESVEDLVKALQGRGVKIVCLTDGERGAYASDEQGQIIHQEKISCPVIERTGAGDAFASGFLSGYLQGKTVHESMLWGVHNAASVIGHVGSQEGLLTQEEYKGIML